MEADPLNNKISIESPLGKVLYKCKAGQEVTVDSPEGKYSIIIEEITKIL
nr:GreA/GreB family elongation factor [Desnuesiella massiliensis]